MPLVAHATERDHLLSITWLITYILEIFNGGFGQNFWPHWFSHVAQNTSSRAWLSVEIRSILLDARNNHPGHLSPVDGVGPKLPRPWRRRLRRERRMPCNSWSAQMIMLRSTRIKKTIIPANIYVDAVLFFWCHREAEKFTVLDVGLKSPRGANVSWPAGGRTTNPKSGDNVILLRWLERPADIDIVIHIRYLYHIMNQSHR